MEWDFIWIGMGIAIAGYFIGDGLKNFKNPNAKGFWDFFEEDDMHELMKEKDVHSFMGISKDDAQYFIQEHPDMPHIVIHNKLYFPKEPLRKWLINLETEESHTGQ